MFCRYCGEKIPDESAFCPFCGEATGITAQKEAAPPAWQAPVRQTVYQQAAQPVQQPQPVYVRQTAPGAVITPGFSDKINDPAILKALEKNKKGTAVFGIILVLAPIVITFILGMKNDDMSIVRGGLFVSAVFLLFSLISAAKKKTEKQWDGTVTDKRTENRTRKGSSDRDSRTETVYVTAFVTDRGKKKKLEESDANHVYYDYLAVGDKVRYHPGFNLYYEKFDKSRDTYAICPVCGTVNAIENDTCKRCGIPVIK